MNFKININNDIKIRKKRKFQNSNKSEKKVIISNYETDPPKKKY